MVKPNHERGFALLECLIAMLILTVLATSLLAGERSGDLVSRRLLEESLVTRILDSRLEELRAAHTLTAGERPFTFDGQPIDLGTDHGHERVTAIEPGLYEVEVTLAFTPLGATAPVERSLMTRILGEAVR